MERLPKWNEIQADFTHGLILGNGASIAFDSRFAYSSLRDRAKEGGLIEVDVQRVFEHLHTNDFELVLRMLWHANKINQALEIPDSRTTRAYESVRDALITVIRDIHVSFEEVSDRLHRAGDFMARFSTVLSLNYDLLVYWAILLYNDDAPNRFKDCFIDCRFQQDWHQLRRPYGSNTRTTLVFYPHGSLAIAAKITGDEYKIRADDNSTLLGAIFHAWRSGDASPVIVCEGNSDQKKNAIRRSPYLSTVYEKVISDLGESIVILGWSIGDNDDHLLDAVCQGSSRRIALAVNPARANLEEYHATVARKFRDRMGSDSFDLILFDREDDGFWVGP